MSRPSKPKPAPAAAAPSETPAAASAPATPDPAKTPQVAPETTGAVSAPASAAAEAAAAPVDSIPTEADAPAAPANDPDGNQPSPDAAAGSNGHVVRVIGPAKGRWRAGRHFGPAPVEIPATELTEADLEKLMADPELNVLVVGEA